MSLIVATALILVGVYELYDSAVEEGKKQGREKAAQEFNKKLAKMNQSCVYWNKAYEAAELKASRLGDEAILLLKNNKELEAAYGSLISNYEELNAAYEALQAQGKPSTEAEQIMWNFYGQIKNIERQCA